MKVNILFYTFFVRKVFDWQNRQFILDINGHLIEHSTAQNYYCGRLLLENRGSCGYCMKNTDMPNEKIESRYNIRALDRAFRILNLLKDGEPRSLAELSEGIDLSVSTTFRLLATLTYYQFVERDDLSFQYRLGLSCLELAKSYYESDNLRRVALPELELLRDDYKETVHLAILDNMEIVYLEKLSGLYAIGLMSSRVGGRSPAFCTAVGKVLLAYEPPQEIADYFKSHKLERFTKTTIIDPDILLEQNDQYKTFIRRVNEERISLKNLHVCLMDDSLDWNCRPFPLDHPYFSGEGRMNRIFYGRIDPELNVPLEQRHSPHCNDLDAMDETVEKLGGLDTVYGGMGFTGLVAYCEAPRSPWTSITEEEYCQMKTRIYPSNEDTIIASAERNFGGLTHIVPQMAITIGFKSMLNTKRVVFISTTGAWKRTAVRVLMFCEPIVEYPATLFTDKVDEVILLTDRNTAESPLPPLQ